MTTARCGRILGLVAALATVPALGCTGDLPEAEDGPSSSGDAAVEASASSTNAATIGSLTLEGEPLIVHGDFELQTHCRYSEGSGTFGFGMHPEDRSGDAEPGPLRFSLTAGPPAGPSIGLEDGTYEAHFNYDESVGDGTVPSYMGDAEMTLRVAGETDRGPPVVEVEARGDDDGIRFELAGRCEAQLWS